jgi:hypothetical protein
MKEPPKSIGSLLVAFLLSACPDPALMELEVATPAGADPLATADRLRLVVSDPPMEWEAAITQPRRFTLEADLEVDGSVGTLTLEALAGSDLVARGETPPMALWPVDARMRLLVAKAGELSPLRPFMDHAGPGMTAVLVPAEGILLAGGLDAEGKPQALASMYNIFVHDLELVVSMPESRTGAIGAICGSTCGVIALGRDDGGLASRILTYLGGEWIIDQDGLSPEHRRENAGSARLEDGSYLVVGGVGDQGPLDTAILLDPGSVTHLPGMTVLDERMHAARGGPAVAGGGNGVLVVAGGQEAGAPPAELFVSSSESFVELTWSGPALARDTAATDLEDGRMVLVGGRDEDGVLLSDAWIVDPEAMTVSHRPDVLKQGRAGHRLKRVGQELVVVGGVTAEGLAATAEVLRVKDLSSLREVDMWEPRQSCIVRSLGVGSFLVAGEVPRLEVYQVKEPAFSANGL